MFRSKDVFQTLVQIMKVELKVKMFIWRLTQNSLQTYHNLARRGVILDLRWQTCGYSLETTMHVFLQCSWAKNFWSQIGVLHTWERYTFEGIEEWVWFYMGKLQTYELSLICIKAYMLQRNRNLVCHDTKGLDTYQISALTRDRAIHCRNQTFKFSVLDGASFSDWQAPRRLIVKFNCDGSWLKIENRAGVACVARDYWVIYFTYSELSLVFVVCLLTSYALQSKKYIPHLAIG